MADTGGIRAGKAFVEAYLQDDKLMRGLDRSQRRLRAWGQAATDMGTKLLKLTAVAAVPLLFTVRQASALEETMNKFNVVFGQNAAVVKQWGDEFAGSIGRSKEQIASFMAGSQDLFVPLGFAADAALGMSKQVTQLAIDLASFNNMADTDTLRDLHAALTGSGEVMKKYGVIVSEAAVKQELFNQGIDPKTASDQQKVQARLNIIMRGTTAAQGDAARSAGSFANQLKNLQAKASDAAAEIGGALLPAATEILVGLAGVAKTVAKWAAENKGLIVTLAHVAGVVAGVGAALVALGAATKVILGLVATVKALHAAALLLTANPLVLTFAAAAAAAVILGQALSTPTSEMRRMAEATGSLVEKGDQLRASHVAQFRRLEELAEKQRLADREMEEAGNIIARLQNRYGDLGLSLDETSGKIGGLADAWGRMTERMAKHQLNQVKADLADLEADAAKLQASLTPGAGTKTPFLGTQGLIPLLSEADQDVARKRLKAMTIRRFDLLKLQGELEAGTFSPQSLTGKPEEAASGRATGGSEDVKYGLQLFHRQQQIRLGMIEDAHRREIELINERFDHEISMARQAGKMTVGMEETRQLELAAARKKHAAEEAEERKRLAEDVADRETSLRDEITRQEIRNTLKGKAQKLALLDLEEERERREAKAAGVDTDLVARKYELLRQAAQAPETTAQAKASVTGGFSAYGVARGVGGYDIQTRIARSTERTAEGVQQLVTEAKNSGATFS